MINKVGQSQGQIQTLLVLLHRILFKHKQPPAEFNTFGLDNLTPTSACRLLSFDHSILFSEMNLPGQVNAELLENLAKKPNCKYYTKTLPSKGLIILFLFLRKICCNLRPLDSLLSKIPRNFSVWKKDSEHCKTIAKAKYLKSGLIIIWQTN